MTRFIYSACVISFFDSYICAGCVLDSWFAECFNSMGVLFPNFAIKSKLVSEQTLLLTVSFFSFCY